MNPSSVNGASSASFFQRSLAAFMRGFRAYAAWLASITWKRFIVLAVLLMITAGIVSGLPLFRSKVTETVVEQGSPRPEKKQAAAKKEPSIKVEKDTSNGTYTITINADGKTVASGNVTVGAKAASAAEAASSARSPAAASVPLAPIAPVTPMNPVTTATPEVPATPAAPNVVSINNGQGAVITIPAGADASSVREAIEEARSDIVDALNERAEDEERGTTTRVRTRTSSAAEALPELAFLWILASALIKFTYKGQLRAEAKAAVATETAEAETLKRQVVEARMAAMQAQVEPHFLFNTLASIDHLIETDPPRASKMQKNLIALLRASMPTMRESNGTGLRSLGSEMAVIQPYLEILKVRMDERLTTHVHVPEGLKSAAFPPMMLQSLVENAIKHGLEPKPEGGELNVVAEIIDGRLVVSVADTGLGFGKAATAGTGVGLANIRERLNLLFAGQGQVAITANQPTGTVVTITVPYQSLAKMA
jgi:signal transduction histidine kinase